MASVSFRNIIKRYGSLSVIEDLSLDIGDGEFIVLLGPSGCGKTSLLHILAGLLPIEGGSVIIDGEDVTSYDPKDRGLAMVFQNYALYPTKSVRGNLKFGLSAQRLSVEEVDSKVDAVAKLLQIDHLLERKPAQLSGGQRQRVAIGRALIKDVSLVLFDEPLSNLDAKLRTEMRMEIKRLHTRLKNTVVYVTHDQVEAITMATRIAVMNKGVVQQVGTPDEIYDEPANMFVADFVGSPAMNMLDAMVVVHNGTLSARLSVDGIILDLSHYSFKAPPLENTPVKVGFRAEYLRGTTSLSARPVQRFDLPLQFTEKVGSEVVAFLSLLGQPLSARLDQHYLDRYRDAPLMPVELDLGALNVFDAQSGLRM